MNRKIITIAHQKGGTGKSTISLNLAVELSKKYNLEVIDLDYQKSLTIFNETRKEKNLKPLNIVNITIQKELINYLKTTNKMVLIDSGGFDSDLNRLSILGANLVITPVSSNLIEIYGLEVFKNILKEMKEVEPSIKSNILLNNIDPKAIKSISEMKQYIENNNEYFNLLDSIIRRRSDFAKSFEIGKSVVEMNVNSKAAQELNSLIDNIETISK